MIITVTMNPAIDKTVGLGNLLRGGLNRIEDVILDAGGKGINVSKTIKSLGGQSVATGFAGGNNGEAILQMLQNDAVHTDFVFIDGETRVNTKIVEADGTVTEFNEAGPYVSAEKQETLVQKLVQYAKEDTWFVLSGSVPSSVPKTIYRDIIEAVHAKGAKVFLDADGELFKQSLAAKPDVVKPNRVELEKYIGATHRLSQEELLNAGEALLEQGIGTVIISLGDEGALFLTKGLTAACSAICVEVRSTVGAGDALVAAFTYGKDKGEDLVNCAKLGIATSAGAVATEGTKPPAREIVEELLSLVQMDTF